MPHDCNGNKVEAGDIVTFRARVRDVYASETACNMTVEVEDEKGVGEYRPVMTFNTRLCEKVAGAK
jgi:acyl-CoA hydrolase